MPVTRGRMASRSIAPASPSTAILSTDTAKWLVQNCVRRSRNGRSVATECEKRACDFIDVHRPIDRGQLERRGDLFLVFVGVLLLAPLGDDFLAQLEDLRQRFGGRFEALALQHRRRALELAQQPVAGIRAHGVQLTGPGAEPEAVGGNGRGGVLRRGHGLTFPPNATRLLLG